MDYGVLAYILGRVFTIVSLSLFLPLGIAIYYRENWTSFAYTIAIAMIIGVVLIFLGRGRGELHRREGYYVVALAWLGASLLGSIPYLIGGTFTSFADAFFETVSGFTTTGASVITNIEAQSRSILFWRSLTQWLGGMGIVVLTVAILSFLKTGSLYMVQAEVPGPTVGKLTPKISHTARVLWAAYTLLTAAEIVLLWAAGMPLFEAVAHAFTTLATGGFSPKNASIGYYQNAVIEWTIIGFMFLAGTNFSLYYLAFRKRSLAVFWRDPEFRFYSFLIGSAGIVVSINLFLYGKYTGEELFRTAFFQVTSIMTTTGYATADFDVWPHFSRNFLLLLMFIGGCYGSTGGAIKVGRILVACKQGMSEVRKIIHPRAIIRVPWGSGQTLPNEVVLGVLNFISLYILLAGVAVVVLSSLTGSNLDTALSAVATTLGNVGPGLDMVGPTKNYAHFPDGAKYLLSFLMLFGRLEIYPLLVLTKREGWER